MKEKAKTIQGALALPIVLFLLAAPAGCGGDVAVAPAGPAKEQIERARQRPALQNQNAARPGAAQKPEGESLELSKEERERKENLVRMAEMDIKDAPYSTEYGRSDPFLPVDILDINPIELTKLFPGESRMACRVTAADGTKLACLQIGARKIIVREGQAIDEFGFEVREIGESSLTIGKEDKTATIEMKRKTIAKVKKKESGERESLLRGLPTLNDLWVDFLKTKYETEEAVDKSKTFQDYIKAKDQEPSEKAE